MGNKGSDGRLERLRTAVHPASQLFLRQQGEPALHPVEPGSAGRRDVHMEARSLEQPSADESGFVRPIVVEDQRHVRLHGDRHCNRVEELPKLSSPLPLVELA